jgi:hypothetical protein
MKKNENFFDFEISKEDEIWLNSISKNIKKGISKYKVHLEDFEKYLHKFPSHGYKHKIGKAINKAIWNMTFPPYYAFRNSYFRARRVNSSDVLKRIDFKSPPLGKSSSGRFNWIGQSSLYLSTTKEGACEEICEKNNPSLIWVSQITYDNKETIILDLTLDPLNYEQGSDLLFIAILNLKLLNKRTKKANGTWTPEYLMTNYIADCCKEAKYNGIAYTSSKSGSVNLVIFDGNSENIRVIGTPEIIQYTPDIEYRKMLKKFDKNI